MRAEGLAAQPDAVAQWVFSNVTVVQYNYPHCYHGAVLQVGAVCVGLRG